MERNTVKMSKLAIVLAATFFFLAVIVVGSGERERNDPTNHINFVVYCIRKRVMEISRLITEVKTLTSGKYFDEIQELKANLTKNSSLVNLLVNDIINDPNNNTTFNATKCRSYLIEYEKTERDVARNLDEHLSIALNEILARLEDVKVSGDNALKELEILQPKAHFCFHYQCLGIRYQADGLKNDIFSGSSSIISCLDERPSDTMKKLLNVENNLFLKKAQDVLFFTYNCTYNGHPPHNHTHHHRLHHRP